MEYIVVVQDLSGNIREIEVFDDLEVAKNFKKEMAAQCKETWTTGLIEREIKTGAA